MEFLRIISVIVQLLALISVIVAYKVNKETITKLIQVNKSQKTEIERLKAEKNVYKTLKEFNQKLLDEKSEKLIAIEKELRTNQFNSLINFQNKIKTILHNDQAK